MRKFWMPRNSVTIAKLFTWLILFAFTTVVYFVAGRNSDKSLNLDGIPNGRGKVRFSVYEIFPLKSQLFDIKKCLKIMLTNNGRPNL